MPYFALEALYITQEGYRVKFWIRFVVVCRTQTHKAYVGGLTNFYSSLWKHRQQMKNKNKIWYDVVVASFSLLINRHLHGWVSVILSAHVVNTKFSYLVDTETQFLAKVLLTISVSPACLWEVIHLSNFESFNACRNDVLMLENGGYSTTFWIKDHLYSANVYDLSKCWPGAILLWL